ncbi:hypothetical protein AJ87_12455 [Rhizobium yanglingense]|nr:hypothetical protein AJ87_12455 [Rhizobium yanglingense]
MRQHEEKRSFGRLLQNFQDGVGRIAVHVVCRIDDDDAPVSCSGGLREEASGAPHLVHRDRRLHFACLLVNGTRKIEQIMRRPGSDLAADGRGRIRIADRCRRRCRIGIRQNVVCKAKSKGCLPDALRPLIRTA